MADRTAHIPLKTRLSLGILLVALIGCVAAQVEPANPAPAIDELMTTLYQRGQFNGAVLVAKQGQILYRKAFGKANFQTGVDFAPETPSDVGSVTKQFTAMAIMILAQQKRLSYDDPVGKYIPEFSRSAHLGQITLRELLNHTSGIPRDNDLGIDDAGVDDEQGLIAFLRKRDDLLRTPGLKYSYSNAGYDLLGIVVERVSGETFSSFLEREIFKPIGMSNTFYVRSMRKSAKAAVGYNQFGDVDDGGPDPLSGDGGIYSTVDDLFKWDQALYTDKLVPQSALSEAFTPGRVQEGTTAYGFGWNVVEEGGNKCLWHTGKSAGFRAFIQRCLTGKVTVIMLTNKGDSKRQDINAAIQEILVGQPYVLPKLSGAEKLYKVIHESGIQSALLAYETLRNAKNAEYDLGEAEVNTLGYQLLYGDKRATDSIAIFKLNTKEHPMSSNAFDSLGEAYWRNGNSDLAIASYETALKLDPSNGDSAAMSRKIRLTRWITLSSYIIGAVVVLTLLAALVLRKRSGASY
jgi:CubicO group peptidase (beta-lactamase class C family)